MEYFSLGLFNRRYIIIIFVFLLWVGLQYKALLTN